MGEQSKTTLISVPFKGTEETALILTKKKDRFFCQMCSASKFASYEGLAEGSLLLHARLKHSLKLTWNKKEKCAERLECWRNIPTCPHCSKEYRRALSEEDLAFKKHVSKCAQGTKRKAAEKREGDRKRQRQSDHTYGNPDLFTEEMTEIPATKQSIPEKHECSTERDNGYGSSTSSTSAEILNEFSRPPL